MKAIAKKAYESYSSVCSYIKIKSNSFINSNASKILFSMGVLLLVVGLTQIASAQTDYSASVSTNQDWDTEIGHALGNIFNIVEGSFGALIMVVAGLAAIIAAAMGAYKAAMGCLVVAVGAFILRAMVRLFFGEDLGTGGVTIEERY